MDIQKDFNFLYGVLEEIEAIDLNLCVPDLGPVVLENETILEGELNDHLKKMMVYIYDLSKEMALLGVELEFSASGVIEEKKEIMRRHLKTGQFLIGLLNKLFYAEVRNQFDAFTMESIGVRNNFVVVTVCDHDLILRREKEDLDKKIGQKFEELLKDTVKLDVSQMIDLAKLIPVNERILPVKPIGPEEITIGSVYISDDAKHLFVFSRKYFKAAQLGIVELSYDKSDSNLTSLVKNILMATALLKIFFNEVHTRNQIDSNIFLGVRENFKIVILPSGSDEIGDFEVEIRGDIKSSLNNQQSKINRNFG